MPIKALRRIVLELLGLPHRRLQSLLEPITPTRFFSSHKLTGGEKNSSSLSALTHSLLLPNLSGIWI